MRKSILLPLLLYTVAGFSQFNSEPVYDQLVFNKRTQLLEIVTILNFNSLNKDTIYNRAVKWFDSEYKKLNETKYNSRLAYKNVYDSVELQITGRYIDRYDLKKRPGKSTLLLSCTVEILAKENRCKVKLTAYNMPEPVYTQLEYVALDEEKAFIKHYSRLETSVPEKAMVLFSNLQTWIENFQAIKEPEW